MCTPLIDENCDFNETIGATNVTTWYADSDNDGAGDLTLTSGALTAGTVTLTSNKGLVDIDSDPNNTAGGITFGPNANAIGIQLGGIGGLAPDRRSDLAKLGLRAMIGGALACCMTACVAGMLISL